MAITTNILNEYASYTYNFKLYAITKEDYNRVVLATNLDTIHKEQFKKKVIIAESGSTSMNITDLNIRTRPTATEGTFLTDINFDIIQPKGYSLIESIVIASFICEWESLVQDPIFILEISFKGVKDNGDVNNNIFTMSMPIKFVRVNTEVSSKGSKYNIKAALVYNLTRPDISTIPEQINVKNTRTFGEFINEFQKQLNKKLREDFEVDGIDDAHEHEFVLEDEELINNLTLADFEVSTPASENEPATNASIDNEGENGFKEYRFSPPTSIPKAIESVLASSPKVQKLLDPERNKGIVTYFEIQPIVRIKEFNEELGDNSLIITWHITAERTPAPTRNNLNEREYLEQLVRNGRINRSYNYYFTGLNTEVTNVDIKMNDIYFNKLAKYNNLFINSSKNTPSYNVSTIQNSLDEAITARREGRESGNPFEINAASDDQGSEIYYVDDVTNLNLEESKFYHKAIKQYSASTSAEGSSNEDTKDSKRFDYNLTLHNIRNNTPHSMLSLTMEIRGDPYWLVPAHSIFNAETIQVRSTGTYNLLAFFMGYPNEIQERNSLNTSYRTDYMFSGLYLTGNVVSKFNNGVFSQSIECVRIADISGHTAVTQLDNVINTVDQDETDEIG